MAVLVLLALPVLGLFGVRLWPKNEDEYDAVALTNKHGGATGVYFTGRVTEPEARGVGRLMIEADAFGGPGGADILLARDGDAVVGALFYQSVPPAEALNEFYPTLRRRISDELFGGGPVVIEVCEQTVRVRMHKVRRDVRVRFT